MRSAHIASSAWARIWSVTPAIRTTRPIPRTGQSINGTDAFSTLSHGDFQEWEAGLKFSMPIGFRQPLAAVRNAQLKLARERSVLQDMELEVSHQMADAIRDVDTDYMLAQTNFNRRSRPQRASRSRAGSRTMPAPSRSTCCWKPSATGPMPKPPTTAPSPITTKPSCSFTSARVRCWSTMAFAWRKVPGRPRRISTPPAALGHAMPACTSTTGSLVRPCSAKDRIRSSKTPTALPATRRIADRSTPGRVFKAATKEAFPGAAE